MFPEPGEKLGPYEILGDLGGGGMARVFRAWDGRLHREVAIKVIDEDFDMPGIGERFLREARAASGLNHPNICTIFDIGEQNGAPYLVMELLEGESLRERIDQNALTVDDILRYGAEVSDALAAAHARGIVHRDIKPANIFLVKKPNGTAQAKVLDFGLAKVERYGAEEHDFARGLTSMGATVGTVAYMSPEQARGEDLDARSDLFSLGIVMYEMATGQLPFRGNTSALVFVQLLGQMAPEPIRKLNGEIPADLEAVIMKLLSRSARARYQSATELTDELHDLAEKRSGWLPRAKTSPAEPMADAQAGSKTSDSKATEKKGLSRLGWGRRSGQAATESDVVTEKSSGSRSGRTSIASNPKVSYPAAAPYMGHSGIQRAVREVDLEQGESSGAIPAETGQQEESRGVSGFSGMRPVAREQSGSGVRRAAGDSVTEQDLPEITGEEKGIAWQWTALLIALVGLLIGMLAWRFGWIGGAALLRRT